MERTCISVLWVAACFSPRPQAGSPCPDGVCPSGLVCASATHTCELEDIGVDAAVSAADAPIDAPLLCFGSGIATICPLVTPTAPLTVTAPTAVDTDTSSLCIAYTGADPAAYCVIAGTTVSIEALVLGVGSKPLVVLATDSLTISGTLDVASHRSPARIGAGSQPSTCGVGDAASAQEGGPGGSFGGAGGTGGLGELAPPRPSAAPAIGTSATLRGGCRGGDGTSGAGGAGGGAVLLIAGTSITIGGVINASGAGGGRSTTNDNGGGGGGSGGMIALDAPTITLTGQLFANGGGGGAGNENSEHGGEASAALVPAPGGRDLDHTGEGGDGAAGTQLDGQNGGSGVDGGGGGGGGIGVIRVFPAQSLGTQVSPLPS